jgi:hypothetical protein
MIALITCRPFRCTLSPTLYSPSLTSSPTCPRSLVAPSRVSSVIMDTSLITPPILSSSLMVFSSECHVPTPPQDDEVKHMIHTTNNVMHSLLFQASLLPYYYPPKRSQSPHPTLPSLMPLPPTSTFRSSGALATPTSLSSLPISSPPFLSMRLPRLLLWA